jgi:hypothetical protein
MLTEVLPWWICPVQLKVGGHQPKICVEETEVTAQRGIPFTFWDEVLWVYLKVSHYPHFEYEIVIYVFTGFYPIHCVSKNSIDNVFLGLLFRPD